MPLIIQQDPAIDRRLPRRKFLAMTITSVGTFALAGCGGGGSGGGGSTSTGVSGSSNASGSGGASAGGTGSASPPPSATVGAAPAGPAAPASSAGSAGSAGNPANPASGSAGNAGDPVNDPNVVTDTSFGVKGDGTTNDRVALQNAIDGSIGQILLITGSSRIDVTGLDLRTNSHVRFARGASIKLLAHDTASYQILRIWDVQNVTLESPTLDGSKELNSAVNDPNEGGDGMGISIAGATSVNITSPTTIDCWGDGIYIANSYQASAMVTSAVTVTGHHATGCRRQGVTIVSGNNITFQSPLWENIAGTLPSAGLDMEPNTNADVLQNIQIVSPVTRNCRMGILVFLAALPGPVPKTVSIDISNHRDEAATDIAFGAGGLSLNGNVVTGHVASASPTFVGSANGFVESGWDSAGPVVEVTNVTTLP